MAKTVEITEEEYQVFIGMNDIEWNVLRQGPALAFGPRIQAQGFFTSDAVGGPDQAPIDRQIPAADPLLQARPRIVGKQGRGYLVQAHPRVTVGGPG